MTAMPLWRMHSIAASLNERYPARPSPLAEPPRGSGLKPVMGDFGPPGVGHTVSAVADPLRFCRRQFDRYGPVFWSGIIGRKAVVVGGPEATEAVLMDRDKAFSAKKGYRYGIGPFFDGGILLRDFDEHLYHRRIMQQAFTRQRLVGYLDLTNPGIKRRLDEWSPGRRFRLYTEVKRLLLDIAAEVFMGTELGPEARRLSTAFDNAVRGGQAIVRTNVPGGAWARGLRGRRMLQEYFRRELPARRAADGTDLFTTLCHVRSDEGHAFDDEDVVDHMIFLMMAAHDTTSIATSMLAYQLGRNRDWQDRLRAESLALGTSTLEYDDLDRLPSLDLAFKETLRMYAPVGQQIREAVKDTDIGGHYIPAGTLIAVGLYPWMRLEPWWHDPDVFDPERFAEHRREDKSHRLAWAPFGGGAHKCIGLYFGGMQAKSIIHAMLLRFRWSVPADYEVPLGWGTGPTPIDGLPMQLERLPA